MQDIESVAYLVQSPPATARYPGNIPGLASRIIEIPIPLLHIFNVKGTMSGESTKILEIDHGWTIRKVLHKLIRASAGSEREAF